MSLEVADDDVDSIDARAFDRILDALGHCRRRQILTTLQKNSRQDCANFQASLEDSHTHLPKLDNLGFINWNPDQEAISKGPKWGDLRIFLHLINDHQDELPVGWD